MLLVRVRTITYKGAQAKDIRKCVGQTISNVYTAIYDIIYYGKEKKTAKTHKWNAFLNCGWLKSEWFWLCYIELLGEICARVTSQNSWAP